MKILFRCLPLMLLLAAPALAGGLNDTGITFCGEGTSGNNQPCTGSEPGGQDAHHGRDAAAAAGKLVKIGGGGKGFDFTKIANNGSVLPASAALGAGGGDWACTRDNVTGLVWEVKTDDNGLRDRDWGYSWYNTDPAANGGADGYLDPTWGESCGGTLGHCNTQAYTAAVNNAGLCGHADWRMPTIKELESLADYGRAWPGPAIDTDYFPNTPDGNSGYGSHFWSGSPSAYDSGNAWYVYFDNGSAYIGTRNYDYHVRLVRGGQ